MFITSCLGNALSGSLADLVGRKTALISANLVFVVSWIVTHFALTFPILLSGRILMGLGCGVTFATSYILQSELALIDYRGTVGSLNNVCWTLGFVFGAIAGAFLPLRNFVPGMTPMKVRIRIGQNLNPICFQCLLLRQSLFSSWHTFSPNLPCGA